MTALDQLHAEHDDIRRVVDVLEYEMSRMEDQEGVDFDTVIDALYFLSHYPDLLHQAKADALYTALLERDPDLAPLVEELADAQSRLKRERELLLDQVEDIADDVVVPLDELMASARSYILAQREHLDFEESHILPQLAAGRELKALQSALKRCHSNRLDSVARQRLESVTGIRHRA